MSPMSSSPARARLPRPRGPLATAAALGLALPPLALPTAAAAAATATAPRALAAAATSAIRSPLLGAPAFEPRAPLAETAAEAAGAAETPVAAAPPDATPRASATPPAGEVVSRPATDPDADDAVPRPRPPAPPRALADVPRIRVVRTADPPVIDGRLDDPAWAAAEVVDDLRQVDPGEGDPPSERTEVRLLVDAEHLYVGIRCFDRTPEDITATQMKRDADLGPDDRVSIVVDPFLDRRNGFWFRMNPLGSRVDALIEENDRLREDWDGIWDGRSIIDEQGWTAEMRIPIKTLSFNPNTSAWGFNVERVIRRRNEAVRWSGVSRDVPITSVADAGLAEGMTGLRQGAGIDVKPFGVATWSRDHDADDDELDLDAGLDVFLRLTPEMTLALTLNTDFAETEVDERQVNLTRFPLFFPEKRDFFLQDAGIFEFGGISRNPLAFFSRRIGLAPDGTPRDILLGAKLTGRVDDLNVGLLNVLMQDEDELGQKNLSVARVSRNVLEQSSIGAIVTYGDPGERGDSWLGGVDFRFRTSDLANGRTLEATGFLQYADDVVRGTDTAYGFKLGYPNDVVNWQVGHTRIGDEFDAALGFVPRRGIREWFGNWRYRWRPESTTWWRRVDARVNGFAVTDLDDVAESVDLGGTVSMVTESGDFLGASVSRERERLDADFEIVDGVVIPAGDYWWTRYELDFGSTTKRPVDVGAEIRWGDFYGGSRIDYEVGVTWRTSSNLTLGAELEMNDVDLPQGDFITRIIRGRANVFFTPDLSWTTFAQFDNVSSSIGLNSRVRWIVRPGSELFVVLNQAIDREGSSYRVTGTEVTTKLGWTLRF